MEFTATGLRVRDVLGDLMPDDAVILRVPRHRPGFVAVPGENMSETLHDNFLRRFLGLVRPWQQVPSATRCLIWTNGLHTRFQGPGFSILNDGPHYSGGAMSVFWSPRDPGNLYCICAQFSENPILWNHVLQSELEIGVTPVPRPIIQKIYCDVCGAHCPEVMNTVDWGCIGAVDGCPSCLADYADKYTEGNCRFCRQSSCCRKAVPDSEAAEAAEALEPSQA